MPLWEVTFRNQYEYPFLALSREISGTPLSMWCIWNRELLQVPTRDPRVLQEVEGALRKAGRVVDEHTDAQMGRLFLLRCTCDRYESIWNVAERHQIMESPPTVFRDGWGYYRVLSFDDARTRAFFQEMRKLGPLELLKKRELPLSALPSSVWSHSLFSDMTGKQIEAVLQAHRFGYYNSPRQVTTDDVAQGMGVSRSTYEEHLRKAENRIISSLVPYLQIYASAERPPEDRISAGLPTEFGPPPGPGVAVGRGVGGAGDRRLAGTSRPIRPAAT
jgi:predicted DNA binding protein